MTAGDYPLTLLTASLLALIYLFLCINVVRYRRKAGVAIGVSDADLEQVFRAQANFAEYVPFALILFALLENAGANNFVMLGLSVILITARILHAWGITRPTSLGLGRTIGASATVLALLVMSIMGLSIFFG